MTNFIFKSANGLLKKLATNSELLDRKMDFIQMEQRKQRADLVDIKRMINRLLIDEHLQTQVDQFHEDSTHEDTRHDLD